MFKKKATVGFHWDALIISALVAFGIIFFYSSANASIPDIGKISDDLSIKLEESKSIFPLIDSIMKILIIQSITDFSNQGILLESNCGNYLAYPILNNNFDICVKEGYDPKNEFEQIFKNKYNNLEPKKFDNLDLSNVNYEFSVVDKDRKFFLKGISNERLEIPIIQERNNKRQQIGKIFPNPSFMVPISYDFVEYNRLIKNIENLLNTCSISENVEACINANKFKFFKPEDFELLENCDSEEKQNFLEFIDYVESCILSTKNSCICENFRPKGDKKFTVKQEGDNILIATKIDGKDTGETFNNIKLIADNEEFDLESDYLHKNEKGQILIQKKFVNKCEQKPLTKIRLCVQSKNNKFYKFDKEERKFTLQDIIYKFALVFGVEPTLEEQPSEVIGSTGGDILADSGEVKERVSQISQEIGFPNKEIALKLAKTESNFQHCIDGTLNCGTSNKENVITNGEDYGVMQINIYAHSDLFTSGSERLEEFGCKAEETAYDLDCNIKAGLNILQKNHDTYGLNAELYTDKVDTYCLDQEFNAKYKLYTDPWDRALRAYNGFGCANTQIAGYVDRANEAIV